MLKRKKCSKLRRKQSNQREHHSDPAQKYRHTDIMPLQGRNIKYRRILRSIIQIDLFSLFHQAETGSAGSGDTAGSSTGLKFEFRKENVLSIMYHFPFGNDSSCCETGRISAFGQDAALDMHPHCKKEHCGKRKCDTSESFLRVSSRLASDNPCKNQTKQWPENEKEAPYPQCMARPRLTLKPFLFGFALFCLFLLEEPERNQYRGDQADRDGNRDSVFDRCKNTHE